MDQEKLPAKYRISRDGEVLGEWAGPDIRQFFLNGNLVGTDMVWDENERVWLPLLPDPHRRQIVALDWSGPDDTPFYYIFDGAILGPRLAIEIDALASAGMITEETLFTWLGAGSWFAYGQFQAQQADGSMLDDAAHAAKCLVDGDKIGALSRGIKLLHRGWQRLAEQNSQDQ